VSGGTSFSFARPKNIHALIDLSRTGLSYIKKRKNGIHMGAATPVADLLLHPGFADYFGGVIHEAVLTLATTPLRNLITIGGNSIQVFPWSTLPPLFLCLDAKFRIIGSSKRTINVQDFFLKQPRRILKSSEILREIVVPPMQRGAAGAFLKLSKTKTDFGLLNVAAVLFMKKGKCEKARVALGAARSLPFRLRELEDRLKGAKLSEDLFQNIAPAILGMLPSMRDFRISPNYKKRVAPAFIVRCLSLALMRTCEKK